MEIKERLEKLPKEKLIRFACDCALINIELIKPHTGKYDEIITFLTHPNAADACATYDAVYAAADAAYAADADDADAVYAAAYAADAVDAVDAVDAADAADAAAYAIRLIVSEDTILKHLTDIELETTNGD